MGGGDKMSNRYAIAPTSELVICSVLLGGSLLYYFRVGLLYSAHFNHGGTIYGTIKGQGLFEGWMFKDRLIDLRDDCWRRFRWILFSGAPLWFAAMIFMSKQVRQKFPQCDAQARVLFYLTFAAYFHGGAKVLLLIAYAGINYILVKKTAGTNFGPFCVWGLNLIWLYCGKTRDFRIWMKSQFAAPVWGVGKGMFIKFPLWHMLMKNISYGMDKHWAKVKRPPVQDHSNKETAEGAYKERINGHLSEDEYGIWCYLVYQFYSPFYMEGPMITYNDFTSQYKGYSVRRVEVFWYSIKVATGFVLIEILSHFLYAEAIAKTGAYRLLLSDSSQFADMHALPLFGPLGCAALICCCMFLYWFKRLIEWRFFRLVGCLDGIEAPDDFPSCVACNLDMQSFWKNWHASYNKWCVRYIYIPMGGSRGSMWTKVCSISAVFAFMAAFHEINLDFAKWGVLLVVFLSGEVAVKWLIQKGLGGFQVGASVLFQERVACVGSTIQLLAFIFVNAGAFTFGMDRIGEALLSFFERPMLCVLIFLACYSNQRLAMVAKKRRKILLYKTASNGIEKSQSE